MCQWINIYYFIMIGVYGVNPPVHGVVPLVLDGETLYTHSTWFSEKQYNGWLSIPTENWNLAAYSSLSTVSFFGIVLRNSAIVKSAFSSMGKLALMTSGSLAVSFLGWYGYFKSQQTSEFNRIVTRNDCGSTPLWKNPQQIISLKEKDGKAFLNRRNGVVYQLKDVKKYKPDLVLLGGPKDFKLEALA